MNFDALLVPINEASPCGDDLSFSPEFDTIQELRRADDPTLDQGEWVTALKVADWRGVADRCENLLTNRSKDLRVAAWLTEASARTQGYAGLADGLVLCTQLTEHFWSELHPQLDDGGDAEQRAGSLRWLLAQVEQLAPQLPVLNHAGKTFSLRDCESAQQVNSTTAEGTASGWAGRTGADDIAAAKRGTPSAFFSTNLAEARRAQRALTSLQHVVDTRMGDEGPGFATARTALADVTHAIERFAREADPTGTSATPGAPAPSAAASGALAAPGGPLRTRSEALQQLRSVAEFFRRTEPHSPVAYLAERAAQWGEMPLHDWLRAVVKDAGALSQMEELLGVVPRPANA